MSLWMILLAAVTYGVLWILIWTKKIPGRIMTLINFLLIMAIVIVGLIYLARKIIGGEFWNG